MICPTPIYQAKAIQDWERRWFANNSAYGLMQQAALALSNQLICLIHQHNIGHANIVICCGVGNNGGDGYLVAKYLQQQLDKTCAQIQIFAPNPPHSHDAKLARTEAIAAGIEIIDKLDNRRQKFAHSIYIDALFGNGLNKALSDDYQALIQTFNQQSGLKIAIDVPSGLHPDTGMALPICTSVDYTLCLMGLKIGLFTGVAKAHVGQIINLPLIAKDNQLNTCAYLSQNPRLQKRNPTSHKGDFGSVAVVGGFDGMGGAAIMAAAAAMAVGAGKVTIYCHKAYHNAALAYLPSVMVQDIENFDVFSKEFDAICFGMGLGRSEASSKLYDQFIKKSLLCGQHQSIPIILDADALYFMAQLETQIKPPRTHDNWICTPHTGEAGRLLGISADTVTQDRLSAIKALKKRYGGSWILKGANTLSLHRDDDAVFVCPFGNAGMATAGMGDVLAGMMAGLCAQPLSPSLADMVSLHALAGDKLASQTPVVSACDMPNAIKQVIKTLTI